jgi:hypothetical protein
MAQSLADIRGEDGQLPAYAFPGGYPMVYVTRGGDIICPECANDTAYTPAADQPDADIGNSDTIAVGDVYWEGPTIECDCPCEAQGGPHFIESVYGDPEDYNN